SSCADLLALDRRVAEPVLAQQRRHVGERFLHARARLGELCRLVVEKVGHRVIRAAVCHRADVAILSGNGSYGTAADGIRARIVATRPAIYAESGLRSKRGGAGARAARGG